jgi:hypothetical protein
VQRGHISTPTRVRATVIVKAANPRGAAHCLSIMYSLTVKEPPFGWTTHRDDVDGATGRGRRGSRHGEGTTGWAPLAWVGGEAMQEETTSMCTRGATIAAIASRPPPPREGIYAALLRLAISICSRACRVVAGVRRRLSSRNDRVFGGNPGRGGRPAMAKGRQRPRRRRRGRG